MGIAEVRLQFDFDANAMDSIPWLWSVIEGSKGLRDLERSCENYEDAVWSQVRPVSLEGSYEEDQAILTVTCRSLDGAEIAVVSFKHAAVITWAEVRPQLVKACGRTREVTLSFVLPGGSI